MQNVLKAFSQDKPSEKKIIKFKPRKSIPIHNLFIQNSIQQRQFHPTLSSQVRYQQNKNITSLEASHQNHTLNSTIKQQQKQTQQQHVQNQLYVSNPRQKLVLIKFYKNLITASQWLGKMLQQTSSQIFSLFVKKQVNYNEAKALCCRNYLNNLLKFIYDQKLDEKHLLQIDRNIVNIIEHLCNVYPQTQQSEANKRLKEAVQSYKIDNSQDDNYDLIEKSKILFQWKESGNYTQEYMQFINYLIKMPFTEILSEDSKIVQHQSKVNQNTMAPFNKFKMLMTRIFQTVYRKNKGNDIAEVLDFKYGYNHINTTIPKLSQEELEHQQKVKQYTQFLIGVKIPESTPPYSQSQLESGSLSCKNNTITRVMMKILQQCVPKILNPQKSILKRAYRFKGRINGQRKKLSLLYKEKLYKKVIQGQQLLKEKNKMTNQQISMALVLLNKYCHQTNFLQYINPKERKIGYFTAFNEMIYIQCLMKSINNVTHQLLDIVKQFRQNWLEQNDFFEASPFYKGLDISLVTCKIGDLIRCKCTSKEQQILRIFQIIKNLNQNKESDLLKIIRIKDRLNEGTRDILLNVYFDKKCTCQIQLAVAASQGDSKQYYFDKFNHFLYEIKRAYLSPILQISNIWINCDSRLKTYKKQIERQSKKTQLIRKSNPNKQFSVKNFTFNSRLPIVCQYCQLFVPYPNLVFTHGTEKQTKKSICGECAVMYINKAQMHPYLMFRLSEKVNTISNHYYESFKLVSKYSELIQNKFCLVVPVRSRTFNFHFLKIIKLEDRVIFVNSKIINQKKIAYQVKVERKLTSLDQNIQLDEYIFFTILSEPILTKVNSHTKLTNSLVTTQLLVSLEKLNPQIKIAVLKCGNLQSLLPYFQYNQPQIIPQIKRENNLKVIKNQIKSRKQVIELDKISLTMEFDILKMNDLTNLSNNLTELYIRQNSIESINFISSLKKLRILHASFNKILKIPELPSSIQQINLNNNQIKEIIGFTSTSSIKQIQLGNNFISQIKGLQTISTLRQLYLFNNSIRKIQGLPSNVYRCNLSQNKITKIQNLQKLQQLSILNLSINLINWDQFEVKNLNQNLKNLKFLNLQQTKLKKISKNLNIEYLQIIFMPTNEITKIENLNYPHLKVLNLNQNKISHIQNLSHLRQLQELQLSQNKISKIQGLQGLVNLKSLYIEKNEITKIEGLQNLTQLKLLRLSSNKITKIEGLDSQFNLETLVLNNNLIKVVQNIQNLTRIYQIKLKHNEICVIGSLNKFLKKIDLSHNKITKNEWVHSYINIQVNLSDNLIQKKQQEILPGMRTLIQLSKTVGIA